MKILAVHNRYRIRAGEDNVFDAETRLLREYGHTIKTWTVDNQEIQDTNLFGKIRLAINTIWSVNSYKKMLAIIKDFKPDIVHVHNILPILSPSIFYACKKAGVPVVQTIHNYRLGCPAATFFREGQICELCLQKSLLQSIIHRCYRHSFTQTLVVASMLQIHKWINTWNKAVDGYIALTPFMKDKLIEIGIKKEKIHVKPNFIEEKFDRVNKQEPTFGKYYLFVGRLAPEKGIHLLLDAYQNANLQYPLLIIGSGELEEIVKEASQNNPKIIYVGQQPKDKVYEYMQEAIALVFPSIWYEGFPLTILEAYSQSLPVIVSSLNSVNSAFKNGIISFAYQAEDKKDLSKALILIEADKKEWLDTKKKAMSSLDEIYLPNHNIDYLLKIYNSFSLN